MFRLIIHWLLCAIALMVVSRLVPGFYIQDFNSALIAAVVIGFLNATLGFLARVVTFPLVLLTFGLFLLVINGAMLMLASRFVLGFQIYGVMPAFWGALILSVLGIIIRAVVKDA